MRSTQNKLGFTFEESYWGKGLNVVGADEVGKGSIAGPVVACVVLITPDAGVFNNQEFGETKVNDSKILTAKQREKAAKWLNDNALVGVGEVSVGKINKYGINQATRLGFCRAVENFQNQHNRRIDHLLIDGNIAPRIGNMPDNQITAIPKGDGKVFSIAAASIVAKVYRDNIMDKLHKKYPVYCWNTNKGYGTLAHKKALMTNNKCRHHRSQFVNTFLRKTG